MLAQAFIERCFELHPAAQVILRHDGSIDAANRAWERLAGVEPGRARDLRITELVHPDDREQVEALLAELGRGDEARSWRARIQLPGGEVRWLDWSAAAPAGEGVVHVIVYDATERHEAERGARERERFLASLLSNLTGLVYRCRNEPDWPQEFISAGCEKITGYPPEDFLANRVTYGSLVHPDDQAWIWEEAQAAVAANQPFAMRYRIRDARGEERWVDEQGCGVRSEDGTLLALEGFVTDVTERVRAEQALAEKLRVIEAQAEAIRSLSTPIIEVWDGVLTLPIVGSIDPARADQMTQALLEAVSRSSSRHVIVDLTGVDQIDTSVASHLMKMLDAVRLLGAEGVLVGIRGEVARTIVALGVDLSHVPTRSDLRDALLDCIRARRGGKRALT